MGYNLSMELSEKVQQVLDSNISGYQLSKLTGIDKARISRLRSGDALVSKLTLSSAEKLASVLNNVDELPPNLEVVRQVIELEFKEVLQSQLDIYNREHVADDLLVFWSLHRLFKEALNDVTFIADVFNLVDDLKEPTQADIDDL